MTVRTITTALLATVSAATMTHPAVAQVLPGQNDPKTTQPPAVPPVSDPDNSTPAESDDIIVTAQRRSEVLTKVPASVQVISPSRLAQANITNSIDLGRLTPGVSLDPRGNFGQPTVRGVGTQVSLAGSAANVAMYIDGIYQVSQSGNLLDLEGLDQIQILKGPQGTLYGRNATGGAIVITTKQPQFTWSGSLGAGVGNYGERRASGFLTGPISDTLAFALTASYQEDNGFTRSLSTNDTVKDYNDKVFRAKLLWKPSERFDLTLIADYLTSEPVYVNSLLNGNSSQKLNNPTVVIAKDRGTFNGTFSPQADSTSKGVTLNAAYHFSTFDVRFYSGFRQIVGHYLYDTDNGPLSVSFTQWTQKEKQYSGEVNIASTDERPLQYVVGVALIHEEGRYDPYLTNGILQTIGGTKTESASVFADLTYSITPKLKVIGGLRYDAESIHLQTQRFRAPIGVTDDTRKDDAFTPRAVIRYEFDDNTNIYASFNRGFKTGGYNTTAASLTLAPSYGPEKITGYEVGLKSKVTPRFYVEAAAYYYDYSGIQVSAYQPTGSGGTGSGTFVYNAAAAKIKGAEVSATWHANDDLSFNLGLAYTHARYSDFANAVVTAPITNCGAGVTPPCGNTQSRQDATGNALYRAPDFTLSGGGTYSVDVPGGRLTVSGNGFYSSGFFGDPGNRLKQPPYFVLDGSIAYSPDGGKFKVSVFGRNLTDQTYVYSYIDSSLGDAQRFAPPRTYGVALAYKF